MKADGCVIITMLKFRTVRTVYLSMQCKTVTMSINTSWTVLP